MGFQGPTPNFRGEKRGEYPRARAPVYFLANDRDRETIDGDISDPLFSLSLSPLSFRIFGIRATAAPLPKIGSIT